MKNWIFNEISVTELKEILTDVVRAEIAQCNLASKNDNELMTREETARFLKITLPTLNSWTKSGKVIAYRIGARVYYIKHEIFENSLIEIKWTPKNSKK
jgi:hypothetical protein